MYQCVCHVCCGEGYADDWPLMSFFILLCLFKDGQSHKEGQTHVSISLTWTHMRADLVLSFRKVKRRPLAQDDTLSD